MRFVEDAARQVVDDLTRGGTPDQMALAAAVADGKRQADQAAAAGRIAALAVESRPAAAHDTAGQFSLLRQPQALVPGYTPNRPLPRPDLPRDTVAALLWLVSDAAPAHPCLPTVAEQDEAWLALFGEDRQRRQAGHVSARANAGAPV